MASGAGVLEITEERARAKQILDAHGNSALDFFKLWPPKRYFFSSSGRSVIGYDVFRRVALSMGDPSGPADDIEPTTQAFLSFCSGKHWRVAFHQVLPDLLPMYRAMGFGAVKFGEEAVVDLEHFRSKTLYGKNFRHFWHRLERGGYVHVRHLPLHPASLLDEVEEVSEEWLGLPHHREYGFGAGYFDREYLSGMPVDALRDQSGRLIAFINEIPDYRKGEATGDLMRHRIDAPNSAMEYLFGKLFLALRDLGYERFNLGLVPFSHVGDAPGASLEERALRQIHDHGGRFFSFKGLHDFKAKFDPAWEERFLVHQDGWLGLLRSLLAMMRATGNPVHAS